MLEMIAGHGDRAGAQRHDWERLRNRLDCRLVLPADAGYPAATRAWNLDAHHRPAAVVMAAGAGDIGHAIRFAAGSGLGAGVMATGHGTGTPCNGGVLVNTSGLRRVDVDPASRTATVQAGARWHDVVESARPHGLAGLAGSSPGVGVVGYTLGGGFGWLGRRFGLACDSACSATVITADGSQVTASDEHNPSLWWGLRGGAGNLGIVTSLTFRLHPVREVYAGNLWYSLDRIGDVLHAFAGWCADAPTELTAAVTVRRFPPLPTVPAPLRGRTMVAVRGCWSGAVADGVEFVDRARAVLDRPVLDSFAVISPADLGTLSMDPVDPLPYANHTELLPDLTDDIIGVLVELVGPRSESPLAMVEVRGLGGALTSPPDALSPMAHTTAKYSLNAIGATIDPATNAAVHERLRALAERIGPLATGDTYVNFLDGATDDRIAAAYSPADLRRLQELSRSVDPTHVFRFTRNIPRSINHSNSINHSKEFQR